MKIYKVFFVVSLSAFLILNSLTAHSPTIDIEEVEIKDGDLIFVEEKVDVAGHTISNISVKFEKKEIDELMTSFKWKETSSVYYPLIWESMLTDDIKVIDCNKRLDGSLQLYFCVRVKSGVMAMFFYNSAEYTLIYLDKKVADIGKEEYLDIMVIHEFGHLFWHIKLNDEIKTKWCDVWESEEEYLNSYASGDCEEDFADSMWAYYVYGKVMPSKVELFKEIENIIYEE